MPAVSLKQNIDDSFITITLAKNKHNFLNLLYINSNLNKTSSLIEKYMNRPVIPQNES